MVNEVHVDHDPVELAQPRRGSNLAALRTGQSVIPFKADGRMCQESAMAESGCILGGSRSL